MKSDRLAHMQANLVFIECKWLKIPFHATLIVIITYMFFVFILSKFYLKSDNLQSVS